MASEDVLTLRVLAVEPLTADSVTVTFDSTLDFKPGQFLTLAIPSSQTGVAARCYSLCCVPGEQLTVGVKRTVDGYASNWINSELRPGDELRVLEPSGVFTPASLDADLLLFAGGSGVTPILSIARTTLARGTGRVVVFYANRDERSVMFASQWASLAAEHPDRLQVIHWLESVQGLPTGEQIRAFIGSYLGYDAFVCGPAPFMRLVTGALKELDFPRERRHQEKFVSLGGNPFGEDDSAELAAVDAEDPEPSAQGPARLEVELDGTSYSFDDWDAGTTLLAHLERKGVKAPSSCREGECSACAFRLLEGEVKLLKNDVLEAEDLADGIRLGCQALPVTDTVSVTYS